MKPVAKVLLAVAIVGSLLVVSAVVIGACALVHLRIDGDHLRSGIEAKRVETHELTLDAGRALQASVDLGSIRVRTSPDASARVVATLRAWGSDQEDANKRLAQMELELGPNVVRGHEKQDSSRKFFEFGGGEEVDLELVLPAGLRLELASGSGDVAVDGAFGDTAASSGYGDVEAKGIRGTLAAKSGSGSVHANDVHGARVKLDSSYGEISLRSIDAEEIDARTSSGGIEASDLSARRSVLHSDYGNVHAARSHGDLDAHSGSGEIELVECDGACRAHSDYGNVHARGRFSGLELTSSSGSVHGEALAGSSLGAGWTLTSDYGEVVLVLAEKLSFELDASTAYGEVRAELSGVVGGVKGDEAKRLHGTVGTGGSKLRLHSSSGDVEIRGR